MNENNELDLVSYFHKMGVSVPLNDATTLLLIDYGPIVHIDWRPAVEDVLTEMKTYFSFPGVEVKKDVAVVRKLGSQTEDLYRHVVLTIPGGEHSFNFMPAKEEMDVLVSELLKFAETKSKSLLFHDVAEDDTYRFLVIDDSMDQEAFAPDFVPLQNTNTELNDLGINTNAPLEEAIFIKPVITRKANDEGLEVLEFNSQSQMYGLKTNTGNTVIDSIKTDFMSDFDYKGGISILDYSLSDTAKDRHGQSIKRYAVHIRVENHEFNLEKMRDLEPFWIKYSQTEFSTAYGIGERAER